MPVQPAFTGALLKPPPMPVPNLLRFTLALFLSGATGMLPAFAAGERPCLDKADQRAAVATHKAVPLAQVVKTRRAQGHHGELVRARLCHHGDDLVYVLTLLGRSGKVVKATVDAANGEAISGR